MSSSDNLSYSNKYDNLLDLINSVKDMEDIEKELIIKNEENEKKINDYIILLEEIINEYHILTMKIFRN